MKNILRILLIAAMVVLAAKFLGDDLLNLDQHPNQSSAALYTE